MPGKVSKHCHVDFSIFLITYTSIIHFLLVSMHFVIFWPVDGSVVTLFFVSDARKINMVVNGFALLNRCRNEKT